MGAALHVDAEVAVDVGNGSVGLAAQLHHGGAGDRLILSVDYLSGELRLRQGSRRAQHGNQHDHEASECWQKLLSFHTYLLFCLSYLHFTTSFLPAWM